VDFLDFVLGEKQGGKMSGGGKKKVERKFFLSRSGRRLKSNFAHLALSLSLSTRQFPIR
jgi:hypothetical protein